MDRWVLNGDGTVTDTRTGLMWQQEGSSIGMTWEEAMNHCENIVDAGFTDWRLPTIKELSSIVNRKTYGPAIDTRYFIANSSGYWSSTTYAGSSWQACGVSFYYGGDNAYDYGSGYKPDSYDYVRTVRGGQLIIGSLDHLIISNPKQGSMWELGDVMEITWDTQSLGGDVVISLSRDGGKNYDDIVSSTPNDGAYEWFISGALSYNCMLKIEPLTDPSKATIQGLFSIVSLMPNQPPEIAGRIPDQSLDEDDPALAVDLTGYESDPEDSGVDLNWQVSHVSGNLFTAAITDAGGDILTITPIPDAWGSETITLTLVDSGGMTDFQDITVTLNPVNDPPALPFNESPVDGSMDVALDTVFSWQCSDPEDDAITPHLYLSIENASADEISNGKMVLDTKEKTAENTVFTWRLTLPPGTLQYNTPYTWRVDAEDAHGAMTQGNVWRFTTESESTHIPDVTTQTPTDITTTTATGHGTITDPGLPLATAHGVCWNSTGSPNTNDDDHTDEGAISGTVTLPYAFTSAMTGLLPDTEYDVRAYATNGEGTAYGDALTFTTDRSPAGFYVGSISGNTGEDRTAATFTVSLTAAPHADVTLSLSSSDTGEGTVSPTSLTFTSGNWNVDQTVTVTGVDDAAVDGDQSYEIQFGAAVSTDAAYDGLTPDPVSVVNEDDDSASGSGTYLPFLNLLLDD